MVAQFLRNQAWWRLDRPGLRAIPVARSVVALLDAAACIETIPDDHPALEKLTRAGCFRNGVFDPGEAGLAVVRGWELSDQPTSGQGDLLAALALAAIPASPLAPGLPDPVHHEQLPASAVPSLAAHHGPSPHNAVPLQSAPCYGSALPGAIPNPGAPSNPAPPPLNQDIP